MDLVVEIPVEWYDGFVVLSERSAMREELQVPARKGEGVRAGRVERAKRGQKIHRQRAVQTRRNSRPKARLLAPAGAVGRSFSGNHSGGPSLR